jgi:hypothetical protein
MALWDWLAELQSAIWDHYDSVLTPLIQEELALFDHPETAPTQSDEDVPFPAPERQV